MVNETGQDWGGLAASPGATHARQGPPLMDWYPRRKRRGDDFVDPYGTEIFTDGSLSGLADALVSETLQNAIDAGRSIDGHRPVRVEFRLRTGGKALRRERAARWFGALLPHLEAAFGGEDSAGRLPHPDRTCPYLTIEDFETCGLTGDPDKDVDATPGDGATEQPQNHFVDFLRSDGRTNKNAGEAGSWGIGKNVSPLSSRILSFLALTVRADDGRALAMGKAVLRNRAFRGEQWQPACYCCIEWPEQGGAPQPTDRPEHLDELRGDFGLRRKKEPGLSLVLPYVDDTITMRAIGEAVLRRYGWAILAGVLEVQLDGGQGVEVLDATTVREHASDKQDIRESLALKAWAHDLPAGKHRTLRKAEGADWKNRRLPDPLRAELKSWLDAGERIALRVPVDVPLPGSGRSEVDEFRMYLAPQEGPSTKPEFVRGHLTLPNVKGAASTAGVRAVVVIREGPLADLLRAAEPPSHQTWEKESRNFRDAYRGHAGLLTFVKTACTRILTQVRETPVGGSLEEGIDCFFLPQEGGTIFRDRKNAALRTKAGPPPPSPEAEEREEPKQPPRRRRLTLEQRDDGFSLLPGDAEAEPFRRIFVQVAYDVDGGNAFKSHDELDFDFLHPEAAGIHIEPGHAAEVEAVEPNRLAVRFHNAHFEVRVTGFDRHRDLRVKYRAAEDDDEEPDDAGADP